jgi:tripartite-type tricarboxylate transporter receptor subunit TctC
MSPFRAQSVFLTVLLSALGLFAQTSLSAEPKGASPIELIVPWGAGGGADQLARKIATPLEGALNTQVTVTNIAGATGNKGMAKLLKAPADGRSLAVLNADSYALLAYANPGWKSADVIPLAVMTMQPSAMFVAETSRFKSWSDLVQEARSKPNSVKVAITGLGSTDYIALEQLAVKGIRLVPVPFGDPQERYVAIMRGQADALYEQPGDVRNFVERQQMRPILVFGAERLPAFAAVPTSKELGYGNGLSQFRAIVVKAGTDAEKVKTLSGALATVASTSQYKELLGEQWASATSYLAGAEAAEMMKRELGTMKGIVDALPLHSRHLIEHMEIADYIEPF